MKLKMFLLARRSLTRRATRGRGGRPPPMSPAMPRAIAGTPIAGSGCQASPSPIIRTTGIFTSIGMPTATITGVNITKAAAIWRDGVWITL